ncbi:hypothetical protein KY328_03030 [Candidatus Woesearchaeota archaeon]|nr:hypothetical protein [Candidatus Woesearchaeota archaeon]MBW3021867.1 hypothetical protein [Candidatus Woesearchaeota archaeon]
MTGLSFDYIAKGRTKLIVPEIKDVTQLVAVLLNPDYEPCDPYKAYKISGKRAENFAKELRSMAKKGAGFIELPIGYKRKVAYRKGLQDASGVNIGVRTPYGCFRFTDCIEAARMFVYAKHAKGYGLAKQSNGDDVYYMDSHNPIHVYQDDDVLVCESRPGIQRGFMDAKTYNWSAAELYVLLHRKFNENIDTPMFFPLLSGQMIYSARAMGDALKQHGHGEPLLLEAYVNELIAERVKQGRMAGTLLFDKEPVNHFIEHKIDMRQHTGPMIERFHSSTKSPKEFYDEEIKPEFEKMPEIERMWVFCGFLYGFVRSNVSDFEDVLRLVHSDFGLFPSLSMDMILDTFFLNERNSTVTDVMRELCRYERDKQGQTMEARRVYTSRRPALSLDSIAAP